MVGRRGHTAVVSAENFEFLADRHFNLHTQTLEELDPEQGDDVPVRIHRALRPTGRAARIQDARWIVLVDGDVRKPPVAIIARQCLETRLDLHDRHRDFLAF